MSSIPSRLRVTHPRETGNGPHLSYMIDRAAIHMIFLPTGLRYIEADWTSGLSQTGRLVHLAIGHRLGIRADWASLGMACGVLSDMDFRIVNHGVAVNMALADIIELGGAVQRIGFQVGCKLEFVRLSRQAARIIRRSY